jgi:hypothetical protein
MSEIIETMSLKEHIFKGYITKNNNIVLKDAPTLESNDCILLAGSHGNTKLSVSVLKIQECDSGGSIYLVLGDGDETKTKEELYNSFLKGTYLIGNFNYFHNPDLIFDIKSFDDNDNSEIKLHYTKPRHYKNENGEKVNCAWRTMTWDLFDEFLLKDE